MVDKEVEVNLLLSLSLIQELTFLYQINFIYNFFCYSFIKKE